jgi:acyl-coenzyme A synthetase/AMP-(fatty) acid ligase/3-hydroxymyristoyl/3-hydroxydecanoyl-(acyl carrier protein) dehydratase
MTFDEILSGFDDGALACLDGRATRTRGDFRRDVDALARRLETRAEARWALYSANSYDFAVGLFALWCARKVPVVPSGDDPAARAALDGSVDAALGELPNALSIRDRDGAPSLARRERAIGEHAELTLLTSGSSGAPKAVRKCARQLEAEVASLYALWGARVADAVVLATVSHQHIYGLLFKVLWPLATGRAFYAEIIRDPNLLRALTARLPRTAWIGSPAQLKRMPERILERVDRSCVVAVFSSGGPLPTAAAHRLANALGEPPIEVYGSTETGGVAYRQQRIEYGADGGSWQPLPRVELDIDDGRLKVRSPHLPDGSWHATGDLGELLADGGLRLGRRVDRIVKLEEKRVSLTAIEESLARCDGIVEAACFVHAGVRDFVYAVVALDSTGFRALYALGRRRFVQRLRDAMRQHVERIGVPRKWRFVDALPANAQGKVTPTELGPLFERTAPTVPIVRGLDASVANELVLALHLPAQLAYFDGHFPGSAVLPGVTQLFWVDLFARQLFDAKGGWRRMEAVKFSRLLLPETDVTLTLESRNDGEQIRFRYAIDGVVCSSGRLVRHD